VSHEQLQSCDVAENAPAPNQSGWIIHRVHRQVSKRARRRINRVARRSVFAGGRTECQEFSAAEALMNGKESIETGVFLEQRRISRLRQLQMVQQRQLLLNQQQEQLMEEQMLLEEQKRHLMNLEEEADRLSNSLRTWLIFCRN
jgi:hypothetical protein